MKAADVIRLLGLEPHPEEGGWFREVHRTKAEVDGVALPEGFESSRAIGTAIYFLLTPATFSEMHRLPGDEIFHFYRGDPVQQLHLHPDGSSRTVVLGSDLGSGQRPLVVVPGGVWQGAAVVPGGGHGYALLGTTMAPGFDFADYERGSFETLAARWPDRRRILQNLTQSPDGPSPS